MQSANFTLTFKNCGMSFLELPEMNQLEGQAARMVKESHDRWGFYPNIVRAYALAPEVLAAEDVWSHGVMKKGFLPRRLKEAIATTVSRTNACTYCATAHAYAYTIAGGQQEEAEAILYGREVNLPDSEVAALKFAEKATRDPNSITREDMDALREFFQPGEIVEIAAVVQQFMGYNWFVTIMGLEVEDDNPAKRWSKDQPTMSSSS